MRDGELARHDAAVLGPLLLGAGHETTANMIALGVLALRSRAREGTLPSTGAERSASIAEWNGVSPVAAVSCQTGGEGPCPARWPSSSRWWAGRPSEPLAFVTGNFLGGAAGSAAASLLWTSGGWTAVTVAGMVLSGFALASWALGRRGPLVVPRTG